MQCVCTLFCLLLHVLSICCNLSLISGISKLRRQPCKAAAGVQGCPSSPGVAGDPQRPLTLGGMTPTHIGWDEEGGVEWSSKSPFSSSNMTSVFPHFLQSGGLVEDFIREKKKGVFAKTKQNKNPKLENHWFQRFLVPLSSQVL